MNNFENASLAIKIKDFTTAIRLLNELLHDNQDNVDILYNLGMCYTEIDQPDKAIEILDRCIKNKPDHSHAYVALGFAYTKKGDTKNAKMNFKEALKYNPNNFYAIRNYGGLFGTMDETEKSLYFLTKAYAIDPSDTNTIYGLGLAYEKLKDFEKAEKFYREILESDAPEYFKDLAKEGLSNVAESTLKSKGFRMDAVFYMLDALKYFKNIPAEEAKRITFEIGMKGRDGFDINDPEKKYFLTFMDGDFSGLQLFCYMYTGFNQIDPSLDLGIDLSSEFNMALKLFGAEDIV